MRRYENSLPCIVVDNRGEDDSRSVQSSVVPVAVAVEGNFTSLFQYRNREEVAGQPFKAQSGYSRVIVVADGEGDP